MTTARLAIVAVLAGILLTFSGASAFAADPYPVATPTPTPAGDVGPDEGVLDPGDGAAPDDANQADDNGILPGTGGSSVYVLLIGGALLVVGGSVVYSSRRPNAA